MHYIKLDANLVDYGSYYDISIDEHGDIDFIDSFDALLITSLFSDKRADSSEISLPEHRRGWIGDSNFGSKLWLYSQSKVTEFTRVGIQYEISNALKFIVDEGLVKNIEVFVSDGTSKIEFEVYIYRFNGDVLHRYYSIWNNTGV